MQPEMLYTYITEAVEYLHERGVGNVDAGLILGSGLGPVTEQFSELLSVGYDEIRGLRAYTRGKKAKPKRKVAYAKA